MLLKLFLTFFKIGLFSFGGGYAMLPLITREVVNVNHWLTNQEFINIVGISQVTPGPLAINTSTYVGYKTAGVIGSIFATFGVVLPSVIIIYIIAKLFMKYRHDKYVENVLKYIRLSSIGLIASAAIMLMGDVFVNIQSIIIFVVAFILSYRFKMDTIVLAILSGITGFIMFK
ncbi:chromate transporter [Clostridium beijerinckii]|nr:chromate transporter [Clostridium beijerinckii]